MALEWDELDGSPTEDWNVETGAFRATQRFKTKWSDRITLANVFLRDGGLPYMHAPDFPGLVARTASIKPFLQGQQEGSGIGVARYKSAEVSIGYTTPSPETPVIIGQILTTQTIEPNAEFMTLDHSQFKWGSSGGVELEPNESPGQLHIGFDYILTQQGLSAVPFHVINYPGTVNAGEVTAILLGLSFASETLLYNPPNVVPGSQLGTWNVSYRFSFRKSGWNKYWRSESQSYESMFNENGQYRSYPLVDFSII